MAAVLGAGAAQLRVDVDAAPDGNFAVQPADEHIGPVRAWGSGEVSSFLGALRWGDDDENAAAAVAAASYAASVDGATLLELDAAAWEELGVSSRVRQAQYVAAVKATAAAQPDLLRRSARALRESGHPDKVATDEKPVSEFKLWTWVYPWLTSDGGTEHAMHWSHAIANAKVDGAEVKAHCYRFLGMYNLARPEPASVHHRHSGHRDLTHAGGGHRPSHLRYRGPLRCLLRKRLPSVGRGLQHVLRRVACEFPRVRQGARDAPDDEVVSDAAMLGCQQPSRASTADPLTRGTG